jgi:tetratricopeptide (TPR) repeat protein
MIRKSAIAAVLSLALALPVAWAQTQGRIEGRVLDSEGRPLEKVAVGLVAMWTSSAHYELTTDKNGKFRQIGLQPGDYQVRLSKDGFAPASRDVHVSIDETSAFEVRLKTVEAAVAKSLSQADNLFLKGNKLYADQKYPEAAAAYEEAIKLAPEAWGYYLNLGLARKKMDRPDEALAAFKKAVELNPDSISANKETGEALARSDHFPEAKAYYEKAVSLSPADPEARYNLGICLSSTGEPEAALAQFEKAVELKPDFADALYQKGTLLIGQNKVPEAVACLEKFLALAPDHEKAGVAKQLLQVLKK